MGIQGKNRYIIGGYILHCSVSQHTINKSSARKISNASHDDIHLYIHINKDICTYYFVILNTYCNNI